MKITHSLFSRRRFLNSLLGGSLAAAAASMAAPLLRFVFPPYREPDEVRLSLSEFQDMNMNSVRPFSWGAKPGILKKNQDGTLTAFVAVCTHLDCNVMYLPEQKRFFCACHEGWYDENGNNIAGPPPSPLRRLGVRVEGEELIILKNSEDGGNA